MSIIAKPIGLLLVLTGMGIIGGTPSLFAGLLMCFVGGMLLALRV